MNNKWYRNSLLISATLLVFFPVGIVLMWLYATWNKKVKIGITSIFGFLLILGAIGGKSQPNTGSSLINQTQSINYKPTDSQMQANYEILEENRAESVINYSVLVKPDTNMQLMRDELIEKCKKPNRCNIWFYDDKKAFELDQEYTKMLSYDYTVEEREEWKKTNYVYIADHLIGSIDLDGNYQKYPYKDSYYKELQEK